MNTWILLIVFSSSGSALGRHTVAPAVIDGFSSEKTCVAAKAVIDDAYRHESLKSDGFYAERSFSCISVQK